MAHQREKPPKPRWIFAKLVLVSVVFLLSGSRDGQGEVEQLTRILERFRPIEARLSRSSIHRPCSIGELGNPSRCTLPDDESLRSLSTIIPRITTNPWSSGIWHLIWSASGHHDSVHKAIEEFQRAARASPNDSRALTDLSAAYLFAADVAHNPLALVEALNAADRALDLDDSNDAALFNRALAMTRLTLHDQAVAAWDDFIAAVPPRSTWAAEAAGRRQQLRDARSQDWRQIAATPSQQPDTDVRRVTALASSFPEEATRYAETKGIVAWASAVLTNGEIEAERIQRELEQLGAALRNSTTDPMIVDIAAAMKDTTQRRRQDLAKAIQLWDHGMDYYARREVDSAAEALARAEPILRAAGSPLALWCTYYRAISASYSGGKGLAIRRLSELGQEVESTRYERVKAYVDWMSGYHAIEEGKLSAGIRSYSDAASRLEASGYRSTSAFLRTNVADALLRLGEPRGAINHLFPALNDISPTAPPHQRRVAFWVFAKAITTLGYPSTAIYFFDRSLAEAKESGIPMAISEALYARAEVLHELGDATGASSDLEESRRWLGSIRDPQIYHMVNARIAQVEGRVIGRRDPQESIKNLHAALEHFESVDASIFLPDLHLEIARQQIDKDDLESAEHELLRAIEVSELHRDRIDENKWRVSYAATKREAVENLIRLRLEEGEGLQAILPLTDLGRDAGALIGAEEWIRVKAVWERLPDLEIPRDAALVSYSVLPDQLLIWVMRQGWTRIEIVDVSRDRLRRAVEDAAAMNLPPVVSGEARSLLYQWLVAPIDDHLTGAEVLYLATDLFLHRVPFDALIDRDAGQVLVQRFALAMTPSAALLLASLPAAGDGSIRDGTRSVLAIGNPQPDTAYPRLPMAREEALEVASRYADDRRWVFLESAASRENVLDHLGRTNVFHFAGHAVMNAEHPKFSRLVLSGNSHDQPIGLHAWEIRQLDLSNTELVVLSACSTARSSYHDSSGVLSLAAPFFNSGVRAVIATLDEVEDDTSFAFSRVFHKLLQEDVSLPKAVRDSKLHYIGEAYDSQAIDEVDVRWASFQLITTRFL